MVASPSPHAEHPLRVLYLTPGFWPDLGGIEIVSGQIAAGLRGRGGRLDVVPGPPSPRYRRPPEPEPVDAYRLDLIGALDARDAERVVAARRGLAALAAELRPDVVHVAFTPVSAYYAL